MYLTIFEFIILILLLQVAVINSARRKWVDCSGKSFVEFNEQKAELDNF